MTTFEDRDVGDLTGQTVIVTGATGGVGLATARAFAAAGAHVVLAVRNVAKGRTVAAGVPGNTEVRQLDLASLGSVRAFAQAWTRPISLLVNNAGAAPPPARTLTEDGFELQFGTNHLGHFALTNLLLGHVTGRVVTLASLAERRGRLDLDDLTWAKRPYRRSLAYNTSKLANLLFTAELQRRLDAAGVKVRAEAAHPGFVAHRHLPGGRSGREDHGPPAGPGRQPGCQARPVRRRGRHSRRQLRGPQPPGPHAGSAGTHRPFGPGPVRRAGRAALDRFRGPDRGELAARTRAPARVTTGATGRPPGP
jgi:NAD(P)-dependent dehydrogenase (short-subunit alcohol dehydrogenase family)